VIYDTISLTSVILQNTYIVSGNTSQLFPLNRISRLSVFQDYWKSNWIYVNISPNLLKNSWICATQFIVLKKQLHMNSIW